jgi:hypothetical protein
MLFDDSIADGKSESRAFAYWFGGEERIEYFRDLGAIPGPLPEIVITTLSPFSVFFRSVVTLMVPPPPSSAIACSAFITTLKKTCRS